MDDFFKLRLKYLNIFFYYEKSPQGRQGKDRFSPSPATTTDGQLPTKNA